MTDPVRPLVREVTGGAGALRPVARRSAAWLVAHGLDPDRADRVELAVHELLANAFEHGHLGDPSVPIGVRIALDGSGAEVAITDRARAGRWTGPPVDSPVDKPTESRGPGPLPATRGRGLALAASAGDGVEVRSDAACTVVTLRLQRS